MIDYEELTEELLAYDPLPDSFVICRFLDKKIYVDKTMRPMSTNVRMCIAQHLLRFVVAQQHSKKQLAEKDLEETNGNSDDAVCKPRKRNPYKRIVKN